MRRLILPLFALVLAAGSTVAVRSWLEGARASSVAAPAPPAPPPTKAVLVAAANLATGSFLRAESLRWQEWPDVPLADSYLVRGAAREEDLVGAVVRRPIAAGEPLALANLVKPGERGFLAAVLEPGMRAVSVPVDEASSNAGLIFPGDRVDLIVTHSLDLGDGSGGTRRVSETVLADVRVIAMGRSLKSESEAADELVPGREARTATLETTPAGAERVALAAELGKLSLSLRSLAADPAATTAATRTWDLEVSSALRPENQPRSSMAVVRGSKTEMVNVRRGVGS